jgi:hypothetical protein
LEKIQLLILIEFGGNFRIGEKYFAVHLVRFFLIPPARVSFLTEAKLLWKNYLKSIRRSIGPYQHAKKIDISQAEAS